MKTFVILCVLVAAVSARPGEKYTDKYDSVDVKEVLRNRHLLVAYMKCALDLGRCSPEGKELKSHIREALENYCAKCTDVQQSQSRLVIGHIVNEEPEYWNQLTAKYDTSGKYAAKYEQELRNIKG